MTVVDPVEYQLGGILQIGVNKKAGLGFGNALRAVLRQDPDIMYLGEMPDAETARIAHEATLTGHLVLTTLNAGSAAEAARWLVDLGTEPIHVARTLIGIVSQRLARRICTNCKEPVEISLSQPTLVYVRQLAAEGGYVVPEDAVFYHGRGCERCRNTGYRGRIGLFEVMSWTEPLTNALLRGATAGELEAIALEQGMRTLLADGIRKAVDGITTYEEVLRVSL